MLLGFGSVLLVIAVLVFFVAVGSSANSLETMARSWTLMLVSAGLFQLGLALALAGAIVRAIWFLPGEEEKVPDQ